MTLSWVDYHEETTREFIPDMRKETYLSRPVSTKYVYSRVSEPPKVETELQLIWHDFPYTVRGGGLEAADITYQRDPPSTWTSQ